MAVEVLENSMGKHITIPPRLDTPSFRKIVDIVIHAAEPDRLILFGSRARGDAEGESDYDFLIVKSVITNEREITGKVYKSLYLEGADASIDLIAVESEAYLRKRDDPWMVYYDANREGVVVYE